MDYDREVSTIAMVSWHPTLFVQMNVQCSLASWHPHEESIQQVGCCFCSNSCSKITCQHIWPVKAMFLRERRARHVRLLTRWCIPSWVRRMTQTSSRLWMSNALNACLVHLISNAWVGAKLQTQFTTQIQSLLRKTESSREHNTKIMDTFQIRLYESDFQTHKDQKQIPLQLSWPLRKWSKHPDHACRSEW